jgi:hypothetical protein
MITTSEFIGIRLNANTDDPKDLDKVIDAIKEAIAVFGYKVDTWGEWNKFKGFCAHETEFIKDLELRLGICITAPDEDDV